MRICEKNEEKMLKMVDGENLGRGDCGTLRNGGFEGQKEVSRPYGTMEVSLFISSYYSCFVAVVSIINCLLSGSLCVLVS